MGGADALWLVVAGVGGGLSGSIAGLASLVSYPALLAAGLPPVTANMTNTVALVFSTIGSVSGSRPELRGRRAQVSRLAIVAVAGGVTGGLLLLLTSSGAFAKIAPWMIGLASLAILIRRVPSRQPASAVPSWTSLAGIFAIAVYGGYFGAAAGVLMLALLLHTTDDSVAEANAVKNVTLGVANSVAALAFVLFGHIRWSAAVPLAAGLFIGGRIGPVLVRRAPSGGLRLLIACAGVGLAVHLAMDAYR